MLIRVTKSVNWQLLIHIKQAFPENKEVAANVMLMDLQNKALQKVWHILISTN